MLATDITCDGIENALEPIGSGDLPQLLQLQKEEYGMCLYLLESQSETSLGFKMYYDLCA
jgi:hypothetical protein